MLPRLSCFWRNRSGNFSTLTAIMFPVVLLGAGLTLNTGTLFLQQRNQQQVTDLAALTATAHLTNANRAALMTFDDNGLSGMNLVGANPTLATTDDVTDRIQVEPGHYDRNVAKPMADRFVAGASPINAVRVRAHRKGEIYFPTPVLADTVIGTTATALIAPEASFSIGSRLADVNTQESLILNSVLGGLLGANLKLSVNDYTALLNTKVDAFAFMDALATELNLTAGTYQQVLDSSASVGQILGAAAKIPGIEANAKAALTRISSALPLKPSLRLSKLLDPGKDAAKEVGSVVQRPASGAGPKLPLLDLVNATAAIASGGKQVSVSSGLSLPGLTDVTIDVAIGEPPKSSAYFKMSTLGTEIYTAQTRVRVVAEVGLGKLNLGILSLPVVFAVKVPLLLDLAPSSAILTAVICRGNDRSTASVTIDAKPALASLSIAGVPGTTNIGDFSKTPVLKDATLVNVLGLVRVTAGNGSGVNATISNNDPTPLTFNASQIDKQILQTANTRNYTQTLTGSLLANLKLNIEALGLGLPVDLGASIKPLLSDAVGPLDRLLEGILKSLGVKLGSVDVWVNDVNCGRPVLVQ